MAYDQWKTDSGYHEPTPEEERERVDAMTQYNADDLWEELENSPTQNIDKLSKELSEAKAEIARLTEENAELKEFDLTKPDAQWREIYDDQLKRTGFFSGQLSTANAEIARLTDYNARLHADIAEIGKDNDELEAEIARLREALLKTKQFIENGTELGYIRLPDPPDSALETLPLIIAALKPDTGEQP